MHCCEKVIYSPLVTFFIDTMYVCECAVRMLLCSCVCGVRCRRIDGTTSLVTVDRNCAWSPGVEYERWSMRRIGSLRGTDRRKRWPLFRVKLHLRDKGTNGETPGIEFGAIHLFY